MTAVHRVDPADFDWSAPEGVAAEVRAVLEAAERGDGAAPIDEAGLLRLRHRGLADSELHVAGEPAEGLAWVHGEDRTRELALVVAPAARRHGLGTQLLHAALAEVEGADAPELTAWSHGNHEAAAVLAERFGLARVRDLWVMRRGLADLPPLEPPGDGVVVRTFRPGQDEEPFLALNAEAFAGHPEQGGMTRGDLDQRMAEPWFDPAGFFVAQSTDASTGQELLGFHWTKVHPDDPPFGEVYVLGVSPRAQGMGLGRLLTLTGLHHLAAVDDGRLHEVLLYVEADNAPAIATYSGLGFTHADADTHVQYRRRPR